MIMFDAVFSVDKDEEKNIQSFSETPSKPVKPKEVTEALDETQELQKQDKEDDEEYREEHTEEPEEDEDELQMDDGSELSEETLSAMNSFQIRITKIISKKNMEYASPSGVEIASCPGCSGGNADAADAAIIDAEITPAEKTVPEAEPSEAGGSDMGGDMGDMGDMDESFGMIYKRYVKLSEQFNLQLGQEGFFIPAVVNIAKQVGLAGRVLVEAGVGLTATVVRDILPVAFKLAKKTSAAFLHTVAFVKNHAERLLVNKSVLSKVWKTKLKLYLKHADENKLAKTKVTAFKHEAFINIAKATIECYDILEKHANKLDNIATAAKPIETIVNKLKAIGISIDIVNDKIDMSELLDSRVTGSVLDLGYAPNNFEVCMKYINEITSRLPKEKQSPVLEGLAGVQTWLKKQRVALVKDSKDVKVSAAARKKDIDVYVASELKVRFSSDVLRVIYHIWDIASTDLIVICEKYEKSLLPNVIE